MIANLVPSHRMALITWIFTLLAAFLLASLPAQAQRIRDLYSFTGGNDGYSPDSALVMDVEGNLYGTAAMGGAYNQGTAFMLTPKGVLTVLYTFTGGTDGGTPNGMIPGADGNFYGTTSWGGDFGRGTVFKLTPTGEESVLYSFTGGADGGEPFATPIFDEQGNLYGTTPYGGLPGLNCHGETCGVVFELTPDGTETVLHSFSDSDGGQPVASLARDKYGNLYGTTFYGGTTDYGIVFKLAPDGTETVLHNFDSLSGGDDGFYPTANVILDSKGNLYGTATQGGPGGAGVVFRLTQSGKFKVLYSFIDYKDGDYPAAGLLRDAEGNLYGTTLGDQGGCCQGVQNGSVFEITARQHKEVTLHVFGGGLLGIAPDAGLIADQNGNLYGTTLYGGKYGDGAVFKITP